MVEDKGGPPTMIISRVRVMHYRFSDVFLLYIVDPKNPPVSAESSERQLFMPQEQRYP